MTDRVWLNYDPSFVPGDILHINGYDRCGIVTGSKHGGVLEEMFAGKKKRDFMVLFWSEEEGFAFGEFCERFLEENAERKGHLNYGEMTCRGADVAEVLVENRTLKDRLDAALEAVAHFRNLANKREDRNA